VTASTPLRFCFGLHLHQPVGNFDEVFRDHLEHVYRPLVNALLDHGIAPFALHLSGPLANWLESHYNEFLDTLGRHVADGRIELLAGGYDEPILAVLSPPDRLEQVARHRDYLRRRFGVETSGLWLTERVWEPMLAEDLAAAGVSFVLVDDRHFRVTGFPRSALHTHFVTECGGRRINVFPIDEQLRYLVPFHPPEQLAEYLASLRAQQAPLAILADDGEKFGGWPGTRRWVYDEGWMNRFTTMLRDLGQRDEVVLTRFDEALVMAPSGGLAYLPSASYREMEGWALPPDPARALHRLEADWGAERLAGVDGGLLRGGHWRHFLVKYPESNRMHKMMMALSRLCRDRGDPAEVRHAIGRAQCNDAYWHGVFGGLYLPHLRHAVWYNLADAEALLRTGESLAVDTIDLDADGDDELWLHSHAMSAVIAPHRGGTIEILTDLATRQTFTDALTRHREAYHPRPGGHPERSADAVHPRAIGSHPEGGANAQHSHEVEARPDRTGGESQSPPSTDTTPEGHPDSTPSIHEIEGTVHEFVPLDAEIRAWLVDRIIASATTRDDFVAGLVHPVHSWATARFTSRWTVIGETTLVALTTPALTKEIRFDPDGTVGCHWEWNPVAQEFGAGSDDWFCTEVSYSDEVTFESAGEQWHYPIETVSKSEKGFDRTMQGHAAVIRWPLSAGHADLTIRPAPQS
jgi:Glycosyl hydrolase family 57/Alpha-amylase/4-alpha-glucanotransferase, middle domain/Alpha-amylase/4-alpha-glucanotransferase, C-terminal